MDAELIGGLVTLCSAGGVIYLIIDKLFSKKKDNAETQATIISNSNEVAELYKKIDEIIEEKTKPIREELQEIKAHWCCYREECEMRITSPVKKTQKK